ncbi:MAG: rod shape-determining protein, partial [Anaerolineales bacterium]
MAAKPLTRRQFLKLSATVGGSAALLGTARGVLSNLAVAAAAPPSLQTSLEDLIVPTVCLLCPSGCGMLARVADGVRIALEQIEPELAADIYEDGIYLTGGGALLNKISTKLSRETGVKYTTQEDPLRCVAIGT